jgi:hypothetical protein
MNYGDILKEQGFVDYFGQKKDKWVSELEGMIEKSGIGDAECNDMHAEKKLFQTIKFSWLGFFVGLYWSAYHGSLYWLQLILAYTFLAFLDLMIFDMKFSNFISLGFAVTLGLYGKSYLFVSKVREFNSSGKLAPPAWGRVGIAIVVTFIPPILLLFGF